MISMYTNYNDLCAEIEILKIQIDLALKEREQWWIGGRLFSLVPLDNAAGRADRLSEQIEYMQKALEEKQAAMNKINKLLQSLEGTAHKIAYKRYIENKPLWVIADELGYSHDHVRRLSRNLSKNATLMPHTG